MNRDASPTEPNYISRAVVRIGIALRNVTTGLAIRAEKPMKVTIKPKS